MKKISAWLGALAILGSVCFVAQAAEEDKTLKGEPIDITCYLKGQAGAGHAACAAGCAKKGQPLGLLVDDAGKKQVYLMLGFDKDKMAEHMGKQVNVAGKVADKDGLKVITVTEVKPAA